jgi:acetoacetyl-CoA synthetase
VPRTLSGKKLEVPVKRLLSGAQPGQVVAVASVADPASLEPFVVLAQQRAAAAAPGPGAGSMPEAPTG